MRTTLLALLFVLPACSAVPALVSAPLRAQQEIEIPGVRLDDEDRTWLQCFGANGVPPEAGSDLISVGDNGDRIYIDKDGGVSLWRERNGKTEVCLVVNQTGGSL